MDDKHADTKRWLKGIPYEVAFWRSYYANRRRRADLFSWSLFGKACSLDNFDIDAFIGSWPDSNPLILDVGCALSYAFGNIINGEEARVEYVDPLAPFYNRILDDYGIERPRIKFGMVEQLSASYPEGSAAFIHIRNALDHCSDPMEGILQSIKSLKVGGVLYLNHFRNEAVREAYRGFHQFNIDERDGKLTIWNPRESIDAAGKVKTFATVDCSVSDEGRIIAVIRKTAPVPETLCNPEKTAKASAEIMIATVGHFHSFGSVVNYQFSRLTSTIGHRLTRLLPLSSLEKLKSLLRKG